jgi:MFS family permease
MTGILIVTSLVAQTQLVPRFGAKPLVVTGMTLGVIGTLILSRLTPDSGYASGVLPGLPVIGLGMGCIFAPAMGTATLGVKLHETGVASAIVNMGQQIGGSVGLAFLSAMSASATASYLTSHHGVKGGPR